MRHLSACLTLLFAAQLAACEDPNAFRIDPILLEDTVEIALPAAGSTLPSAVDLATPGPEGIVTRFPERTSDAELWDFTLRRRGGSLVFVPGAAVGLRNTPPLGGPSTAGITLPLPQTFSELIEAPAGNSFVSDSVVTVQLGAVYAARSRRQPGQFSACENYAKIQPLEVDVAAGRTRLRIVVNQRCSDPRLVPEE